MGVLRHGVDHLIRIGVVTHLGIAEAQLSEAQAGKAQLEQTVRRAQAQIEAQRQQLRTSRSRQCEFAVLRCAGSTVRGVRRQVVIEAGLYVGTALLISLVPLVVTTAGESLFYARAGMPLVVRPGVGPVLLVALLSFLALVAVLLAPIRSATRTPIGTVLAAE